ncbi:MAG: nucleotidyltransferase domain-containing protein [Bacillota bacterium]
MPVRLLSSSILKWPDASRVDVAVRRWAKAVAADRRDVVRVGYFGSYARGAWGVGSDLDLVVIVADTDRPFEKRGLEFDTTVLPVPADLLVYKQSEWEAMLKKAGGFPDSVQKEAVWIYP